MLPFAPAAPSASTAGFRFAILFSSLILLLGATAQAHRLTLVARDRQDIERSGLRCLNSFEPVVGLAERYRRDGLNGLSGRRKVVQKSRLILLN